MFKCFNLRIAYKSSGKSGGLFFPSLDSETIRNLKETYHNVIHEDLEQYISASQSNTDFLNGDKLQSDYFANVPAQIFLSHSHSDEKLALWIKNYFKEKFDISVFVDSCVWGYCNDLLKEIDDEYCYLSDRTGYNYNKRNNSTAIVHMMLSTALTQMMDKCECIFFLNTQQSNLSDCYGNEVQTASPWIYHELSTMKVLREIPPERLVTKKLTEDRVLAVTHKVSLADIPEIQFGNLYRWLRRQENRLRGTDLLDDLYREYKSL